MKKHLNEYQNAILTKKTSLCWLFRLFNHLEF